MKRFLLAGFWSFSMICYAGADAEVASTDRLVPVQSSLSTARTSTLEIPLPFKINQANRRRFAPHIDRIARKHRLDPDLIHAVISVESGFNPRAVSHAGAMGLMQLMPATARRYGVDDPYDPIANISGGVRHLRFLLDKFRNISLALAAYNAGANAVMRHRRSIPPYLETRMYVVRVIHFYMHYKNSR